MGKNTKKENERIHATKRAKERYDIHYNRHLRREFVEAIQNHRDAKFIKSSSQRTSIWDVCYNGIPMRVVYDCQRKEIVTFLPAQEMVSYYDVSRTSQENS